jgi:hypothetical protein
MIDALSARKASKQELAELRKLLDEYEKGAKSRSSNCGSTRR